jgi:hypothetical protein
MGFAWEFEDKKRIIRTGKESDNINLGAFMGVSFLMGL